ncbi:MAG: ribosome maturation factor RimM [Gammaproteobacteria bacterium]|nr:ribosome maturation factor RimM [Gammaproteobacteria bacterium]
MATDDVVIVGRIGGAFGVRGWVHINSFTEPPENILGYSPWLIARGSQWEPLRPVVVKPHGQGFIARFEEVGNREQAQALSAIDLGIYRDTLPALDDDDEYYWRDLVGLDVVNVDGSDLGKVSYLLETGAHDVLVIHGGTSARGNAETLIPFSARFVRSVDIHAGRLEVDW